MLGPTLLLVLAASAWGEPWPEDASTTEAFDLADLALSPADDLPVEPLSPPEMARALKAFQEAVDGPVLVAGAGPEAFRVVENVLRTLGDRPLEPAQVPYGGDLAAEMDRVLKRTAVPCGVRVAADTGGWRLQAFGACRPPEEEVLDEEEILQTEALEEIPVSATDATFASPLDSYRVQRLVRAHLASTRASYGVRWTIQDGQGHSIPTAEFARRTGDVITTMRLLEETRASRTRKVVQAGIGGGILLAGGWVLANAFDELPAWRDYKPGSRYDFPTDAAWEEAVDDARAAWDDARASVPYATRARADNRAYTGIFLSGAGLSLVLTVPFVHRGLEDRQDVPALYYHPARAQVLIDAYNADLRKTLGLDAPAEVRP